MGRRGFSIELAKKNGLAVDRYPATKEETQKVEEILAAELAKLSVDDHEKILLDVHGLPILNANNEDQEDDAKKLAQKLAATEQELRKLDADKRSAYEQARYLNPEYVVQGGDLFLNFLRSNDHDPFLAADQIAQHFETKRQLFGPGDVLGRPVLQSDLTETALEYLEAGSFQILPSRDAAGRVVLFTTPGYAKMDKIDDLKRAVWYIQQAMSSEEGVSRDGFVMINYSLGKYGAPIGWEVAEEMHNQISDGAPIRMSAGHHCYDDPKMEESIAGLFLFGDERYTHRWRLYFGKKSDVHFKFQTYGLPTEDFPVNDDQTLDLGWHRQWLASQRARELHIAANTVLVPRRFDVLFGRGSETRVHTGNLRAVHLVEMSFEEYDTASKKEKTAIAGRVVAKIHESYGRFLKWEEGGWVEVDFETARFKISHFFRRRRITKKENCTPDNASK